MQKSGIVLVTLVLVVFGGIGFLLLRDGSGAPQKIGSAAAPSSTIRIVAAENFWGSIAAQIGGPRVQVVSVVTDPNIDPHEYASNASDARAVAAANYVILNGAGYDSWMDKLIAAGAAPDRKVLNVADLLGKRNGDNPHFWYDPDYVHAVAARIEGDLISLDPAHAAEYEAQYRQFEESIAPYEARIAAIKQRFAGTQVASTEDIFSYLANATGLDLISPPAFITAVAEGNDPPASSLIVFQRQLVSGQAKILVYNEQTVTPLTESMKTLAAAHGIPIVGITETIQPPTMSFENWMNGEITGIQNALAEHPAQ